jgi:hypothetical protein
VIGVGPDPIPNVGVAIDSVNRSVLHGNSDGKTVSPVAPTFKVVKLVAAQRWMYWILDEKPERTSCQLSDIVWQTVEVLPETEVLTFLLGGIPIV